MSSLRLDRADEHQSLDMVGSHPSMTDLYDGIRRAARVDAPVVVCGPTGSGKELVARAVHRLSAAGDGPFCAVNVAALPEGLIESELFGTVRGAFTGALADRPGLVESAEGGSLFLDEAGDLALVVQPKLLRLVEYGEVRRVGATKTTPVRFRLLVAVQDHPDELRRVGRWRNDLYYRLTSVILRVPALKDRRTDIPDLAITYLSNRKLAGIAPEALALLAQHDWPGNVRELQQTLVRAAFWADDRNIEAKHVRRALESASGIESVPRPRTLTTARWEHVRTVVAGCGGDTRQAAELLGITRRHLYRLLRAGAKSLT